MPENRVIAISGTSRGIGRYLAQYYAAKGIDVIGCSRNTAGYEMDTWKGRRNQQT